MTHRLENTRNLTTIVLVLLLGIMPFGSLAKGIPKGYPLGFDHSGVVGKVDIDAGKIVIQDTQFHMPANLKVVTPRGKQHTIHTIRMGQRVGVTLDRSRPRHPVVTQLWILPKSHPGLIPPDQLH